MKLSRLAPLLLTLISLTGGTIAFAETYHGIRNKKCAANEEEAKAQVFAQIEVDRTLCGTDGIAAQTGGWSCHRGGGNCPKSRIRCNTQYRCAKTAVGGGSEIPATVSISPNPSAAPTDSVSPMPIQTRATVIATPVPMATPVPTANPVPANTPVQMTNPVPTVVPMPTMGATSPMPPAPYPTSPSEGPRVNPKLTIKPHVLTP